MSFPPWNLPLLLAFKTKLWNVLLHDDCVVLGVGGGLWIHSFPGCHLNIPVAELSEQPLFLTVCSHPWAVLWVLAAQLLFVVGRWMGLGNWSRMGILYFWWDFLTLFCFLVWLLCSCTRSAVPAGKGGSGALGSGGGGGSRWAETAELAVPWAGMLLVLCPDWAGRAALALGECVLLWVWACLGSLIVSFTCSGYFVLLWKLCFFY